MSPRLDAKSISSCSSKTLDDCYDCNHIKATPTSSQRHKMIHQLVKEMGLSEIPSPAHSLHRKPPQVEVYLPLMSTLQVDKADFSPKSEMEGYNADGENSPRWNGRHSRFFKNKACVDSTIDWEKHKSVRAWTLCTFRATVLQRSAVTFASMEEEDNSPTIATRRKRRNASGAQDMLSPYPVRAVQIVGVEHASICSTKPSPIKRAFNHLPWKRRSPHDAEWFSPPSPGHIRACSDPTNFLPITSSDQCPQSPLSSQPKPPSILQGPLSSFFIGNRGGMRAASSPLRPTTSPAYILADFEDTKMQPSVGLGLNLDLPSSLSEKGSRPKAAAIQSSEGDLGPSIPHLKDLLSSLESPDPLSDMLKSAESTPCLPYLLDTP